MSENSKLQGSVSYLTGRTGPVSDDTDILHGDTLDLVVRRTGKTTESWVFDARTKPKGDDWLMLYQMMAAELASCPLRSITAYRVLFHILSVAGFGNSVSVNQAYLGRQWGCSRQTVSAAIKSLVANDLVERLYGKPGAKRVDPVYRLNPNLAWKGKQEYRRGRLERWAATKIKAAQEKSRA